MDIYNNFPLKDIIYYKIGGSAKFVLKILKREDLLEALEFVKKNKIRKVLPVGLGSNLLVSDNFFDGAVLWFAKSPKNEIILDSDGLVKTFASTLLDELIQFSFDNNLIGLEWAGGLPSTVGGALRGNAGAFGGEIKDNLYKAEIFELLDNGEFVQKEMMMSDLQFSYRNSIVKKNKNLIIGNCFFKLEKTDKKALENAKNIYFSYIEYRNQNHPVDFPSCGSVFKNITKKEEVSKILSIWVDVKDLVENNWHRKVSMGYVIKRLGFSNFTIGGAKVSERHANYIVNFNNAKFDDVFSIIEKIKDKFDDVFGFLPEVEVEIVK